METPVVPPVNKPVSFDFHKEEGVIEAQQFSANALANQTLPVANALGIKSAAQGRLNLENLKLRCQIFAMKFRKEGGEVPPLLSFFEGGPKT